MAVILKYILNQHVVHKFTKCYMSKNKICIDGKRGSRGSEIKSDFQEEIRNKFYQMSYIRVK